MTLFRQVDSLLSPRSIAIVGAQPDPTNWGLRIAKELERHGYAGDVNLVSTRHDIIDGRATFANLAAIPVAPDHLIALVSASRTVDLVEEAGALGVRSTTVLAAGFGEAGTAEGLDLDRKLRDAIDRYDMAVCGPNCMGFASLVSGMTSFSERYPVKFQRGNFALVSQSGGMMGGIIRNAAERGIGFSHAISTGNEINRDVADFIHYLATDPATAAIGVLLEGVRRPAEFAAACEEALAEGKPIVLLQSGRTERGQESVKSHTGVLAASGATMDAVVERLGLIRVESVTEFIEMAELTTRWGAPTGSGLAVVALSGGARNMIIDLEDRFDLPLPKFSADTLAELDGLLPVGTNVDNPLDIGLVGLSPQLRPAYLESLAAVLADPSVGALAIQEELPRLPGSSPHRESLAELSALAQKHHTPLAFYSRAGYALGEPELDAHAAILNPFLQDVHDSMKAIGAYLRYYGRRSVLLDLPSFAEGLSAGPSAHDRGRVIPDLESYGILQDHGVPIPSYDVIEPGTSEVVAYSGDWPVALKLVADGIEHKSDVGGVVLGIESPTRLTVEVLAMRDRVGEGYPLLVQQMVGAAHLEIFVSAYRDPSFGWILLLGVGGLWAEQLSAFSSSVLPRTMSEVRAAIDANVLGRILDSSRGGLMVDREAIATSVLSLCNTAADPKLDLLRLEVNPLLARERDCVAVDVVMEALE